MRPSWEPISDLCRQYIEKDGVPVIHIAPDILNADLKCELLRSRSAVVGESPRSGLVKNKFQMEGIAFESIPRSGICAKSQKAPEFDFLIIDSGFENDLRREIACSSGYRLDQIIDVTHLLDGGYFA